MLYVKLFVYDIAPSVIDSASSWQGLRTARGYVTASQSLTTIRTNQVETPEVVPLA